MTKRPRTSESLDALSMTPSTSSSNSKWSLKRFSKISHQQPISIDLMSTNYSSSSSSSSPLMFDNRGIFQPSAAHHYNYSRNIVEESLDPTSVTNTDELHPQSNHKYLKPENTSINLKNNGGKSPGTKKAKEVVQFFSSFLTTRLNPSRRSTNEIKDTEMTESPSDERFWSSHDEFTTALALQENAPRIETRKKLDAIVIDDEMNPDYNEFSGGSSSASNNSAHISSPWHSPTPTLLMHFPISPKTMPDRTSLNSNIVSSPIQDQILTLEDFEVLETLGTGTFGRVLLVRQKSCDPDDRRNYFAMKVLKKEHIVRLKQVEHINSERSILLKTDHPFLVKMKCTFQDSLNCYMLMEFVVGGEIFTHLRRQRRFPVDVTRFYIATLVLAISYLHSKGIIYRDLKPENLLIDDQGYIKITDFGFAKELIGTDRTWTLCGTPEYLSPEVIQSQGQTFACDYWCLGILMYEMLCGHPPFFGSTPFGTYEKILAAKLYFPNHVDAPSRDLISSLLTVDVSKRLGNLRGGAFDVMNHPWFRGVDWHMLLNKKLPPPIRPHQNHPSDSSNFEKYNSFDLNNMPGMHLGLEADRLELQRDPFSHLFSSF